MAESDICQCGHKRYYHENYRGPCEGHGPPDGLAGLTKCSCGEFQFCESKSCVSLAEVVLDYLVWLKIEKEFYRQNQHAREWLPHVEKKLLELLRLRSGS